MTDEETLELVKQLREARLNYDRAMMIGMDHCCSCHINPPCRFCTEGGGIVDELEDELYELRDKLELGE